MITVTAPITSLRIDKGTEYTTTLASGFVFLKALYEPANATEKELVWTARNVNSNISEPVASVDKKGVDDIVNGRAKRSLRYAKI